MEEQFTPGESFTDGNACGVILVLFYFIYLFLERGEGREREGEKHQCVVASGVPPTGDLACNPGTCPYWESNW